MYIAYFYQKLPMMAMIRTLQGLSDYKTGLDSAMRFSVDAGGYIELHMLV